MAEWTMSARAEPRALCDALAEDQRVLVFGEDVGVSGGVFRVTDGLQAEFGDRRVFDTPISEAAIAGAAVGLCASRAGGRWSRCSSTRSPTRRSSR